jgi:hypothetical protein
MKYLITENQLKLIKKYMGNFINEEMSDDEYERRQERGDMQIDPDDDEHYDDKEVKSLTIYYMSRENMLNMKNNPKLDKDKVSVIVGLNFSINNNGNILGITDEEGEILENSNDIINSLYTNSPQNMKKQEMQITKMLRQKVASNTFINYIDELIEKDEENKKVLISGDEISVDVVM